MDEAQTAPPNSALTAKNEPQQRQNLASEPNATRLIPTPAAIFTTGWPANPHPGATEARA